MATPFHRSSEYPVPPERLLELLTDTAFIAEQERHFGALSVNAVRQEAPEGPVIVVEKSEPGRSATGKKDPSRPDLFTTTQRWNLSSRCCRWSMVPHAYKEKVSISGMFEVHPRQRGCELVEEGEIDIRVPLIGRLLEQRYTSAIERKGPAYRDFILAHLAVARSR